MRKLARLIGSLTVLSVAFVVPSAAHAAAGENGDIAYDRFYKGGSEIFSIDPATGKSQRLTSKAIRSGNSIAAASPSFSPDGQRIVFTNAVKLTEGTARRNNVFVMRADGSHPKQLTRSKSHLSSATFTADDKRVSYAKAGDTFVMKLDGSEKTNITAALPGGGVGATFSPDGTKVAVATTDGGDSDIVVMNVDGTDPVNVTASSDAAEYSPDFSPDGSRLAFVTDRDDFNGDVWVMNADGSSPAPVAALDGVEDGEPSFSPDGTKLAYSSRLDDSGAIKVFTIGLDGSGRTQLPKTGSSSSGPDWGVAVP